MSDPAAILPRMSARLHAAPFSDRGLEKRDDRRRCSARAALFIYYIFFLCLYEACATVVVRDRRMRPESHA